MGVFMLHLAALFLGYQMFSIFICVILIFGFMGHLIVIWVGSMILMSFYNAIWGSRSVDFGIVGLCFDAGIQSALIGCC